jgi:RNA polymerase sigma factor (sigma-70 family)
VGVSSDRYEAIYRSTAPKLWRALVAFSGDRDVASDALGEAFAQGIARGDELREPTAWIWKVAFAVARAELKNRARMDPMQTEEQYELPDSLPHVFAALSQLSENQRLAIVLHDYADRPTDEVAAVLGAARATVHVHLSRGRRRMRELLGEQG